MAQSKNQSDSGFGPPLRPQSVAVTVGRPTGYGDPLNVPINLASNFRESSDGPSSGPTEGSRVYSRAGGTETWDAFEQAIGALEGGDAISFSSGMGAVAAIFALLEPGSTVLVPEDCYHGVAETVNDGEARLGWVVQRLPGADTDSWLKAIPNADLVWLESPSNPLMEIADIPTLCNAAKDAGVACAVDNTFATPLLQRPLDHGATFSVHSATKFIGGHSDLLMGVVISRDSEALAAIDRRRMLGGATPGALESFLALRGLRTLPIRLERSQANAEELAIRLSEHRTVSRVRYPGLPDHPGHELASTTLGGPGAMLSFETVGSATSADIRLSRLRLISVATSLGGVESTIERRAKQAGQEHLPETLMRLSVGIEHIEDLWADLEGALDGSI